MIEKLVDEMILHMNEKYDDTFSFVHVVGQRVGAELYRIVAASSKYPDDAVFVTWHRPKNKGEKIITDNYVGIIHQEQTKTLINKLLKDEFGEKVFVKYTVFGFPLTPDFDESTSFEKYAKDIRSGIQFSAIVVVDSETIDVEEMEKRIRKALGADQICCGGSIYFTNKEEDLHKITDDKGFGVYYQQHSFITRCEIVMKNSKEFSLIKWEKRNG